MTNHQGTEWESELVTRAKAKGLLADRYPKRGEKHEPDVYIGDPLDPDAIPVVAWKRLAKLKPGQKRRTPDGERDVVVMSVEDFLNILATLKYEGDAIDLVNFDVQCKWIQNLNVTRTLAGLRRWLEERRG